MTTAAIAVDSLSKSYGSEQVLRDIDLEIADGEFCVVVGPSGCGKTTLLDCIAGVRSVDAGSVSFGGRDVTGTPAGDRHVGYVFQDFEETLFPHRTTAENIAFGVRHGPRELSGAELDREIDDLLELLAISEARDSPPSELSGGQQQRVELARQLIRDCDVMLFDDPLSDLDYKLGKRMELEMRRIHRERGDTFLYVTHNQDQALKLADRLVVMNEGIIEQVGTPDEVYHRPENAYVARFVGDSNAFVGTVESSDGDGVVLETEMGSVAAAGVGDSLEAGTESMAIVRPELVEFGEAATDKDNRLEATFEGSTYMGDATEFVVSIDGFEGDFIVTEAGHPHVGTPGEQVTVGWDAADCLFFETISRTGNVTARDLEEM